MSNGEVKGITILTFAVRVSLACVSYRLLSLRYMGNWKWKSIFIRKREG